MQHHRVRLHLVLALREEAMVDPLIVDAYEYDGPKDWAVLASAGRPWAGAILKATQGTTYRPLKWFGPNWDQVRVVAGSRYGQDWLRGAYHYLDTAKNGTAQADYFLGAISAAGGLQHGDVLMVDVERADQPPNATADRVVTCTWDFVHRVKEVTDRDVILYGGEFLSALNITEHCGARWLAVARYTATLPAGVYNGIGWDAKSLALWQYCGDGEARLPGYPNEAPGCGRIDISAAVLGWDRLPELFSGGKQCNRPFCVAN